MAAELAASAAELTASEQQAQAARTPRTPDGRRAGMRLLSTRAARRLRRRDISLQAVALCLAAPRERAVPARAPGLQFICIW